MTACGLCCLFPLASPVPARRDRRKEVWPALITPECPLHTVTAASGTVAVGGVAGVAVDRRGWSGGQSQGHWDPSEET
jgi:hypothetical protein